MIGVAAAASSLAACLLVTSVDGLSGGAADIPGSDAAGAEAEAPADADAAPASDADAAPASGADASPDAPASDAGPRFCQGREGLALCADFDDGLLPGPWATALARNGGEVTIADDGARGTRGLSVRIGDGAGAAIACTEKVFAGPRAKATIELDVRADRLGTNSFDLLTIGRDDETNVSLQVNALGRLAIDEDLAGGGPVTQLGRDITLGAWTHVSVAVNVAGEMMTVTVTVGVTAPVSVQASRAGVDGAAVIVQLSDCYVPATDRGWAFRYDDVTLTFD
jgi:hypothetical protein